jgi:membrane-associated protease RseP (regulator of RpoE activity)
VSTRAVGVLTQFLELDEPEVELAAETILEEIAASRVTSAAARAETALVGYREGRQEKSLERLRELGASVVASALNGEIALVQVTIGDGWRGDTPDLAVLKRLPSLQRLSIYENSVDDRALKHLMPLKQLTYLDLFGTSISDQGIERLKEKLTSTQIDRRKGGLLGVMGDRSARGTGCLVTTVQPGTAADKAGLQAGDVIVQFNGQNVDDFTALTELISAKAGGETVELEIERQTQVGERIEKQRLTKKATLDQWKTRMTLNTIPSDVEIILGR